MEKNQKSDIVIPSRPNPMFQGIKDFTLDKELGEGALAKVYLATHRSSRKQYAIKKVIISTLSKGDFENVEKEIEIHMGLDCPHIIKMYDFFKENGVVYLVLELAKNGNLFKYLTNKFPLEAEDVGKLWTQTVLAIDYLHDRQIIMRDLKPENLLLDENLNVKLCDFGWASKLSDTEYKKLQGGTFIYMSPETLKGENQDKYSDVWSLGILLFELHHNREPFSVGDSCDEQLYFLKVQRIVFKKGFDRNLSDIIYKLLKMKHQKRPTIKQILKDPYVLPFLNSSNTKTNQADNLNGKVLSVEVPSKSKQVLKSGSGNTITSAHNMVIKVDKGSTKTSNETSSKNNNNEFNSKYNNKWESNASLTNKYNQNSYVSNSSIKIANGLLSINEMPFKREHNDVKTEKKLYTPAKKIYVIEQKDYSNKVTRPDPKNRNIKDIMKYYDEKDNMPLNVLPNQQNLLKHISSPQKEQLVGFTTLQESETRNYQSHSNLTNSKLSPPQKLITVNKTRSNKAIDVCDTKIETVPRRIVYNSNGSNCGPANQYLQTPFSQRVEIETKNRNLKSLSNKQRDPQTRKINLLEYKTSKVSGSAYNNVFPSCKTQSSDTPLPYPKDSQNKLPLMPQNSVVTTKSYNDIKEFNKKPKLTSQSNLNRGNNSNKYRENLPMSSSNNKQSEYNLVNNKNKNRSPGLPLDNALNSQGNIRMVAPNNTTATVITKKPAKRFNLANY